MGKKKAPAVDYRGIRKARPYLKTGLELGQGRPARNQIVIQVGAAAARGFEIRHSTTIPTGPHVTVHAVYRQYLVLHHYDPAG